MSAPVVVWRFHDGKAGHDRQTAGLLRALAERLPLAIHALPVASVRISAWRGLRRRLPAALAALPAPQLLLGAGHACEWPLIAARRARGGRSVYLMKPSFPTPCFDLCFVPRHDGVPGGPHVEQTEGVLNDLAPGPRDRPGPSMVLVGGPSKHHGWDEAGLLRQVASIVFGSRPRKLVITDSRRTPAATAAALASFEREGVRFVSHRDVGDEWLRETLAQAPAAWVTADSVSMLFEAMTAGCAVGLLEVPAIRNDRISGIAPGLLRAGRVSSLASWLASGELPPPPAPLAEAARCAAIVHARLLGAGAGRAA